MSDPMTGAAATPSASAKRSWKRLVIRGVLTIGVTWLILDRIGVGFDEIAAIDQALPEPALGLLAASVAILLSGFLLSARLWGRMVAELGSRDPGPFASMRIWMSANLGRYVPGKIWQIAGLVVLSRRAGLTATIATTAGVLGQTFSLAAAAVLAAPLLVGWDGSGGVAGTVLLIALGLFVLLASVPPVLRGGLSIVFRLTRLPLRELPETTGLFGPRWLLWYLVNWAVYGLAFVTLVVGLGFDGGVLQLAGAFAGAYLLGYVAVFAPAGIGVREGFLILFLEPHVGGAAVGVAVLARVWMTLVEIVPAGALALVEVFRGTGVLPETDAGQGGADERGD